jgi:hypothetical protein
MHAAHAHARVHLGGRQRPCMSPTSSRPRSLRLATPQGRRCRRTSRDRTRDQAIASWALAPAAPQSASRTAVGAVCMRLYTVCMPLVPAAPHNPYTAYTRAAAHGQSGPCPCTAARACVHLRLWLPSSIMAQCPTAAWRVGLCPRLPVRAHPSLCLSSSESWSPHR